MTLRDVLLWAFPFLDEHYVAGGIQMATHLLEYHDALAGFHYTLSSHSSDIDKAAVAWYRTARGDLRRDCRKLSLEERVDFYLTRVIARRVQAKLLNEKPHGSVASFTTTYYSGPSPQVAARSASTGRFPSAGPAAQQPPHPGVCSRKP